MVRVLVVKAHVVQVVQVQGYPSQRGISRQYVAHGTRGCWGCSRQSHGGLLNGPTTGPYATMQAICRPQRSVPLQGRLGRHCKVCSCSVVARVKPRTKQAPLRSWDQGLED